MWILRQKATFGQNPPDMPYIQLSNAKYYYEEHGSGTETIVFSHGLLWSGHMFHKQVAALKDRYRVITYDHRGQGRSEVTASGYDMDTLSLDAAELIEKVVGGPVIFGGLSMGGFVGMRLAARHPALISKLILMETTADPEPQENVGKYKTLNWIVKNIGFWPVTGKIMQIMFGRSFLTDPARAEERRYWIKQLTSSNKTGMTRAVMGVVDRKGIADEAPNITCPTLILVGDEDVATVPAKSQRLHALIPHSKLVIIPRGGHTASVEEPAAYNREIEAFLAA